MQWRQDQEQAASRDAGNRAINSCRHSKPRIHPGVCSRAAEDKELQMDNAPWKIHAG